MVANCGKLCPTLSGDGGGVPLIGLLRWLQQRSWKRKKEKRLREHRPQGVALLTLTPESLSTRWILRIPGRLVSGIFHAK
jgi:hypothetical protein